MCGGQRREMHRSRIRKNSDPDGLGVAQPKSHDFGYRVSAIRWVALWAACLLAGCSRSMANVAPVEGLVLFNGLPARAGIVTQGLDEKGKPTGRPSNADTHTDGTFTLTYSEHQPGALLGTHRVTVSVYPVERAEGELGFQQRFRPVKVVRFTRQVKTGMTNRWNFVFNY